MLGRSALSRFALVINQSGHEAVVVTPSVGTGVMGLPVTDVTALLWNQPFKTLKELRREQEEHERQRREVEAKQRENEIAQQKENVVRFRKEVAESRALTKAELNRLVHERKEALAATERLLNERMGLIHRSLIELEELARIQQEEEDTMMILLLSA